jgi:hypothetical protein
MNIHQVSVNYAQEQDRILARISTTSGEELRLWLTRRLSLGFLPLLKKIVAEQVTRTETAKASVVVPNDEAKQVLADFKREELLQKSDFSTPYQPQAKALPLGPKPLLVTEVKVTPLPGGQLQIGFNEKLPAPAQPRGFQVLLEPQLTHGFLHLYEKAVEQAQWLPSSETLHALGQPAEQDKPLTAAVKPKYLN